MQQQAQDPSRQGYGAYNQGGYNQGNYNFPAAAFYGQYPGAPYGGNFQAQPVAFNRGRGRGAGFGQGPYGGRGGYMMGGAPGPYGVGFQNFGGRGGAMFGMRPRRKKPFVGGSLEPNVNGNSKRCVASSPKAFASLVKAAGFRTVTMELAHASSAPSAALDMEAAGLETLPALLHLPLQLHRPLM
eukprot:CAMPEP_0176420468 /NCGR_PEP_ID=MMETSP0127-20121128/8624_1 /TAXON_ID=938130 /ORGANISM="Platyophrya macrostoma, Strain WH" /LENGTH=184 /DNA_ID=CAMNT_0017801069 /DNA_START=106 /DNA_END=661 /DNA_ORIENTATION=-